MIDKKLVTNLFNFIKANQGIDFDSFIAVIVSQTEHTTETATEWVNAFITAMFIPKIIDEETFDAMKNKVSVLDENSVDMIIDITEKYLKKNPLHYKLREELSELQKQKEVVETEPDVIENTSKTFELQMINDRIEEIQNILS